MEGTTEPMRLTPEMVVGAVLPFELVSANTSVALTRFLKTRGMTTPTLQTRQGAANNPLVPCSTSSIPIAAIPHHSPSQATAGSMQKVLVNEPRWIHHRAQTSRKRKEQGIQLWRHRHMMNECRSTADKASCPLQE